MQRRRVLAGLAAAGVSLLAGCNSGGNGGSGNNTTNGGGNGDGGGTSLAPTDSATPTPTPAATTMAETARATATQTAIATSTPAPTSTPAGTPSTTAMPTAVGTAGLGTATGSMDIDLSNRETYTNDAYSYTIEYPAAWSINESGPSSVSFTASASPSVMTVFAQENVPTSISLDQATESFLSGYQQSTGGEGSSTETLNQQDVTLPNDYPARLFDFRLSSSSSRISVRQKVVITIANGTLYAATIVIPGTVYTSSVGEQADEILMSLTISGGPTGTTSS